MAATQDVPTVVRHDLGRVVSVLVWSLAAIWLGVAGRPPGLQGLLVALGASGLAWTLCWRPRVIVAPDSVTVVNPLRRVRIPWTALDDASFGWALRLRAGKVDCRAVAAPGPARMGALYDRHVTAGGVFERDAISRAGVPAPALLAVRQQWALAPVGDPGRTGGAEVLVTPAHLSATVLALSVAASATGLLWRLLT